MAVEADTDHQIVITQPLCLLSTDAMHRVCIQRLHLIARGRQLIQVFDRHRTVADEKS